MKTIKIVPSPKLVFSFTLFIASLLTMLTLNSYSYQETVRTADKTLSPYFFIDGDNSETDQLPLKHTSAQVNIAGVVADVHVKQVYVNTGESRLEAIYIFPASTKAAVYGMKMIIGKRILTAKIERKEQARQQYEMAKDQGRTASLLEQQRPNVFQMNVANILPGDSIEVLLSYTELLVPEEGVYEFVYPTVVGPRYSNQPEATASTNDIWVENPYLPEGQASPYSFDITTSVNAGMPIKHIACASHDVNINFDSKNKARVLLKGNKFNGGNRDYILRYRLSGSQIESGVLLYEGNEENFFLAMLQPPKLVRPEQIPGREYIFIVDVSGSMNGFPLDISKKLLKDLIGNLRPTDRFNVLLFAASNSALSETSLAASNENIQQAINLIDRQRGGGGTELLPAIKRALALPGSEGFSRSVVIVTDGYVTVEKEAFDLIRHNLSTANFFAFGIGSSVNRYIIEGMARVGNGLPFVITDQKEAGEKADKFRTYIQSPVLTDIEVDYGNLYVYDVEPYSVPDVLADKPVVLFGKYKGQAKGAITISGISGDQKYQTSLDLQTAVASADNAALAQLWARERIALLDDYNHLGQSKEIEEEVTNIGLQYNLLTAYTSFVAIDSMIRNDGSKVVTVKQPLPLPKGVSDKAVGTYGTSTYGLSSAKSFSYNNIRQESRAFEVLEDEKAPEAIEEEQVFKSVQHMPEFPGGKSNMQAYFKQNLVYPKTEQENKIEGTVYISVVIGERGEIIEATIRKGVSTGLDAEALRLIKKMPLWKPGLNQGKAVKVQITIPVKFSLS